MLKQFISNFTNIKFNVKFNFSNFIKLIFTLSVIFLISYNLYNYFSDETLNNIFEFLNSIYFNKLKFMWCYLELLLFYPLFLILEIVGFSEFEIIYNDNLLNKIDSIIINILNLPFKNGINLFVYLNELNYDLKYYNHYNLPFFFFFYVLFIFTTLFSFFYLSFLGFYGVFILNLISIVLFWISSLISFNDFFLKNTIIIINIGKWFVCDLNQQISFELLIDSVSYSFFFLTLTISVFVYMFTFSYFRYEPNIERFTLLLNAFVISMICLVLSGNCFVIFLGWELIGLTSFFLINFWSTKISVLKSAFKAFSFNKLSDVSLFCFLLLIMLFVDETNINVLNENWSVLNNYIFNIVNVKVSLLNIVTFFLLLSICIKSAQFGFHLWLPDSMEAPVPASALIHSATLVSAGIFLLLRFTYLFELSIYGFYIIPLIGSFTAFFGGLGSVYQSDSKKILAYSTISHCGFLMVCYSTFIPEYTILYLYVHGFFKAAIFLCLGNIIRFFRNVQDIRRMGGLWKYLPFECFSSFVCLINLSGLPFTLGFYIKHLLLLGNNNDMVYTFFVLVNILGGAVFGIIYSFRFFYYIFFDFKKSKKIIYNDTNKKNLISQFYTNSSLSSNYIISLFIIISYFIIIYLFFIFLNKNSLGEGFITHSINSSKYDEFLYLLPTFSNNISYFNWFLIILILILIFVNWRIIFFNYQINFFIFLNLILFFFFFLKL